MQKSSDLAQAGAKLISLINDAMLYAWRLFIEQFTILLATRWDSQPAVKIIIVVVVVVLLVALVGRFIGILVDVLAYLGAIASYAFAALFSAGLVAALINWLMRAVPTSLALN